MSDYICDYCGCDKPHHYLWCQAERVASLEGEEEPPFGLPPPRQAPQHPPAGLIPPEELIGGLLPLTTEDEPPEGGKLEGTKPAVEGEAHQRRILVIVEWDRAQPFYAAAKLVEVGSQPGVDRHLVDQRILGEVSPFLAGKKATDTLSGETYRVVISLKVDALKSLNQLDARIIDPPRTSLDS